MAGTLEILPKGTKVEGHVEPSPQRSLAFALDCYERDGAWFALSTNVVSRTANPSNVAGLTLSRRMPDSAIGGVESAVTVPADSIIGFTLTRMLTA